MAVIIRVDWGSVTLAEYAALDIIKQPDPEAVLNLVWDEIHAHNPFRGDAPSRLSVDGQAWLVALRETVTTTLDEHAEIAAAREFVREIGTLVTLSAHRRIR